MLTLNPKNKVDDKLDHRDNDMYEGSLCIPSILMKARL